MDHYKQEPRSLIMCTTPLQMLIAEKIIEMNSSEKFDLILIVNGEINNKFKKYFNRLMKKCNKSMIFELNSVVNIKKIKEFLKFKKTYKNWSDFHYSSYYLASIDNVFFHWILSKKMKCSNFFTFDDGVANIFINSLYFNERKIIWREYIWKLLGVDFTIEKVKKQSKIHYTIYPDKKNIIDNKKNIKLFSDINFFLEKENKKEEINLFLGQPLYELNKNYDENYILQILGKFSINLYFPHPREKYNFNDSITVIRNDQIFEDYIIELLYNYKKVNIFTFLSTAALNVEAIPGVRTNYLINDFLKKNYNDLYILFESGLSSNLLNVE